MRQGSWGNSLTPTLPPPTEYRGIPRSTGRGRKSRGVTERTIVHLLYYTAERRTEKLDLIEDVVPIFDLAMSLKLEKAPKRVYVAPEGTDVPFEYLAGRVNLRVPEINGHAMIVFE